LKIQVLKWIERPDESMATIKQSDFIQSVADALQYISYYHPEDFITNLTRAYELEQSPAAKDAMARLSSTLRCAP
jgi:tartrate dehydratase alpha subunit/fumarate hydratase class I-like protein